MGLTSIKLLSHCKVIFTSPIFGPCLLWPNGCMHQDTTWYENRPQHREHCVRWGPRSLPLKGHSPQFPIFDPCLLWPNGWMDQDATWYGGKPWPWRHCVRWEHSPLWNAELIRLMEGVSLRVLVALKWRVVSGGTMVAVKRAGCVVWQLDCQASNVTASVQSDHLLHGCMLPVFMATDHDQSHRPPRCAEN